MSGNNTKTAAVDSVLAYLAKYHVTLDDLINIGGDELNDHRQVSKARRVDNSWTLMASLGVAFADLEASTGETTVERPSAQRGEGVIPEHIEIIEENPIGAQEAKPLKTNDIPVNHQIGGLAKRSGRWQKRKLCPPIAAEGKEAA